MERVGERVKEKIKTGKERKIMKKKNIERERTIK